MQIRASHLNLGDLQTYVVSAPQKEQKRKGKKKKMDKDLNLGKKFSCFKTKKQTVN